MRVRVMGADELASGEARLVVVDGHRIAVVRIDDDWYALDDTCSHANVSLSEGEVLKADCEIECWKHGATFSLRTGAPTCLPAVVPVATYAVIVDGDDVLLDVLPDVLPDAGADVGGGDVAVDVRAAAGGHGGGEG